MIRNYTKTEVEYRTFWIEKVASNLGKKHDKEVLEIIGEMFDESYDRSTLEIENTQTAETFFIPAERFFLNARKRFILNESGTLTEKHKIKLGVIIPIIWNSIKIRQIKKRAKIKAAEEGDSVAFGILNNEEYSLKIIING